MTHPTDEELDALVKLTEEFVTATWHLLDNSETSGPNDDPIITVWQPNFDEVSALLDRCEGLPSGSMEHMAAGELLAANLISAITALRAQLVAANARAERAEASLAARQSASVTPANAMKVPEVKAMVEAARKLEENRGVKGVDIGSLRVDLYRAIAALESAPRVSETPKSERDSADVLTALPAIGEGGA